MENILDEIEKALEKNDEVYKELDDFSDNDKFAEIFKGCPFVKRIRNATDEEKERYCYYIQQWIIAEDNKSDYRLKEQFEELMSM